MISASLVKDLREKTGAGMLDCKKALEACDGNIDASIDWLREKGISKAAKKADRIAAEGIASINVDGNKAVILEVNSETDFVAKNEEFKQLVDLIAKAILNNDVKNTEDVLKITDNNMSVEDQIIAKTSKIGEKLSFRRFEKVIKNDNEVFGAYLHMGSKIVVLTVLEGTNETVAKDVAMHIAAMHPLYINAAEVPTEVLDKEKEIMKEQLINEGKPSDRIESILIGKVKKYYEDVCLENQIFIKAENKETVLDYVNNNGGKIIKMIRFEVGEGMEKRNENFAEEVAKQMEGK